jgi:hypothetical protein
MQVSKRLQSNRRRISAKLSLLSLDLTGVISRNTRAYGELPADEQGRLDDQIMKIIDLVLRPPE